MIRIGEGSLFIFGGYNMDITTGTQVHTSTGTQECKYTSRHAFMSTCVRVYMCACVLFFIFSLTGCTQIKQLQNLDPLLTLKDFSDEKDDQAKWVDEELQRFEGLMAAVQDGSIKDVTDKGSFLERFGDPVVIDNIMESNISIERWLYRHPIQKLATDRVYFFFDADGRLLRFERVGPTDPSIHTTAMAVGFTQDSAQRVATTDTTGIPVGLHNAQ